ncbi:MAG TPA: HAMP domain-containing sensor histidine kinase [Bryobacteraceae bacterium]|nr:HAMP domain-containing sensor histidine kinase [Bryobacteraceae bacterium]
MSWPRFSRLSLLWKILLSTSVAVTALFAVTGLIVLGNISSTVSDSLEQEVHTSFQAYTSLWNSRAEWLGSVSTLLSTMPNVRAAFTTQDPATIQDVAGELWSKISTENAIFLVTDPGGKIIASLGGVTSLSLRRNLGVVEAAAPHFPKQSSGFFLENGELYDIAVTPVYVDSTQGQELLDVLVAGYHVDAVVAQELTQATGGSEFLFLAEGRVIASTLNPQATAAVVANMARARGAERVSDGVVEYARLETPLLDINRKPVGEICVLRSFEDARRRIAGMKTKIVLLWLLAVSVGLLLTYLLARRIVEPVKQLDRAAAEVARQNYAIQVEVNSQDEMGRLARTFNTMCASLRQAREELIRQERISTIGRLSGSIVHDLRNPLAAIYGGSEMLVDADLPPAHVKRLAGNIYRASRRIQELLQDLLNVSRGKTQSPEMCRLREVALAACESLAAAAESQGVAIALEIPGEIELPLERNRMERAFVNLIGNALEAMPEGGQVRLAARLESGAALVEVADNGPGIAAEIRHQLFQPFVSAGKRNGLGLGLALTRQTVLEHGGDLWVDSEPGRGARFVFRLPGAHLAQPMGQHV